MNSKTLIGVVAVVVIVIAVAAVAVGMGGGSEEKAPSGTVIIYDGNGGTYNGQTVEYSAISVVINSGWTNADYTLVSWNTSADGTGTTYHNNDSIGSDVAKPVRLYAQWAYVMKAGEITSTTSTQVDYSDISYILTGSDESATSLHNNAIIPSDPKIMVYYEEGKWDWVVNGNSFVATNSHGDTYTLTITFDDHASNVTYEVDRTIPTISFESNGNVTFNIHYSVHYNMAH